MKTKGTSGRSFGGRQKVKTAKRRSAQSTRWLERQLNDPYVKLAKAQGYRSRAAFKLLELDEKFDFIRHSKAVVDLGIAPGGWTQVIRNKRPNAPIVGIDLLPVEPIEGAVIFEMDFTDNDAPEKILEALGQMPDLIISDMAANTVGHKQTDHLRTMGLVEMAVDFAVQHLVVGGTFIAKVFAGGTDKALLDILKANFTSVKHAKPPASRKGSVEWYVIAKGKKEKAADQFIDNREIDKRENNFGEED
ncbi:rRNA methyltransferase [Sphingorhabdus lutea]|uniref:Ribosomal RNA large subunit methyltransferase E n=1 Tax=Sphingorhabdus lutea TaxID=1913578 RepID=A0A1L3JDP8_9SPHN|nr:RlmE family RNA methyltransferase [Sphingorhabdus lutea]APG63173.1 rRNA methyltransferase [Sphingorhabdus lutea]